MPDKSHYGQAIRHLQGNRRSRDVADRAGVPPSQWSAWLKGERRPTEQSRVKIAEGLAVPVETLEEEAINAHTAELQGRSYPHSEHDRRTVEAEEDVEWLRRVEKTARRTLTTTRGSLDQLDDVLSERHSRPPEAGS